MIHFLTEMDKRDGKKNGYLIDSARNRIRIISFQEKDIATIKFCLYELQKTHISDTRRNPLCNPRILQIIQQRNSEKSNPAHNQQRFLVTL